MPDTHRPLTRYHGVAKRLTASHITLIYAVAGGAWILFSDRLLASLTPAGTPPTSLQTLKGWLFVALTALLLHVVLRRALGAVRRSEQVALERQRFLTTLMGNLPGMVYRCRNDPHWTMEFVNDGCQWLTGYRPDELVGNRVTAYADLIHPDDRDEVWVDVQEALEERRPFELAYRVRTAGGDQKWVREYGCGVFGADRALAGLEGFVTDVSRQKQTEDALQRTAGQYEELFTHMLDGFALHEILCDANGAPVDYRFLAVNPAFERLTGLRTKNIVGRRVREVLPQVEEKWIRIYGRVARTGKPAHFKYHAAALGREYEVRAYRPATGQFAAIFTDITERKRLERQLRQAQKMEAIGVLTSGIAHDFNNSLSVVLANTDLVASQLETEQEEIRGLLDDVGASARSAAAMVRQLMGFSRQADISVVPIDVTKIAAEVARLARRLIPETIDVTANVAQTACTTRADPGSVRQMLLNLVTNARDAMPKGGRLEIGAGAVQLDADFRQTHPGSKEGDFVCVWVADTGTGMDEATKQRIFDPFFTTKPKGKGTGLGMAMVFGLMKQHGGYVDIESAPGAGTTMRLYFAAVEEPVVMVSAPRGTQEVRGGTETIVVVEDQGVLLRTATRTLESLGYRVLGASDGIEALTIIHKHQDEIDLVLSDMVMPGMSGPELFKVVHGWDRSLPFVFASGYGAMEIREGLQGRPSVRFVQKPWTRDELAVKLREALDAPRPARRPRRRFEMPERAREAAAQG